MHPSCGVGLLFPNPIAVYSYFTPDRPAVWRWERRWMDGHRKEWMEPRKLFTLDGGSWQGSLQDGCEDPFFSFKRQLGLNLNNGQVSVLSTSLIFSRVSYQMMRSSLCFSALAGSSEASSIYVKWGDAYQTEQRRGCWHIKVQVLVHQ